MANKTILVPQCMPVTPGEILLEHYLKPRKISATALAEALECSRKHVSQVIHGKTRIEADLATRLGRVLKTSPEFWLNLQNAVDLYEARQRYRTWKPAQVFTPEWAAH